MSLRDVVHLCVWNAERQPLGLGPRVRCDLAGERGGQCSKWAAGYGLYVWGAAALCKRHLDEECGPEVKEEPMREDEGEYAIADRYFVDDGELEGLEAPAVFALGVQWAMFRAELLSNEGAFSEVVFEANADRILKMCWNNKRSAEKAKKSELTAPGWVEILVASKGPR